MLIHTLQSLFARDLARLRAEIEKYSDEKKIWVVDKGIANSAGNLCLHLVGNLNTYIGAQLGNSGYVRDRPLEFSTPFVPKQELLNKIDETATVVAKVLTTISEESLSEEYPLLVLENKTDTGYFLVHLATHLNYHLGQVNYHRRLLG